MEFWVFEGDGRELMRGNMELWGEGMRTQTCGQCDTAIVQDELLKRNGKDKGMDCEEAR